MDKNRDAQQDVFFDFLGKSELKFVQGLCQFKDLLTRVLQLGDSINSGGSLSKNTARRMSTNKSKPTVSDAFRLQLAVLVDVLQSTNPWYVPLQISHFGLKEPCDVSQEKLVKGVIK